MFCVTNEFDFCGLKDWAEILKMYEKDDLYLGVYWFASVFLHVVPLSIKQEVDFSWHLSCS